jgi:hypothetical protein
MTDYTSQLHQFQQWPRSEVTPAKGTTPGASATRHISGPTSHQHSKLTIYSTLFTLSAICTHKTLRTPTYFTLNSSQHVTLCIETLIDSVGHHSNALVQSTVIILPKCCSTSKSVAVSANQLNPSDSSPEQEVAVPGTPEDLPEPRRPPINTRGTHTWPFGVKKRFKITLPRAWGQHTWNTATSTHTTAISLLNCSSNTLISNSTNIEALTNETQSYRLVTNSSKHTKMTQSIYDSKWPSTRHPCNQWCTTCTQTSQIQLQHNIEWYNMIKWPKTWARSRKMDRADTQPLRAPPGRPHADRVGFSTTCNGYTTLKWKRGGARRRERRRCTEKRGCQTLQSDGEIHDRRVKNSSLSHEVHVITHIIVTLKH